jgi:hypothetical protein
VSDQIVWKIIGAMLVARAVFAVGPASAAQLTLSWIDNAGGTTTFNIERKTGAAGTYAWIGTTGTGVTSYLDSAVVPGTTYCYRVKASSALGDSGYSNEACGTPAAGFDVSVVTTGSGTVVSAPGGITCPGSCVQSYAAGTVLTLTATPATGSSFSGWSGGGCAGAALCVLTGNAPATVTAAFTSTGGSSSLTAPSLTVNTVTAVPGGAVTAMLTNGFGGSTDWLALAQVGAPDTSYLQWIYAGAGVTTRTWTVTMPTTPGQYEFRFFSSDGYVRAATSPAVTIATANPAPSVTGLSPGTVAAGGSDFSLTVSGNNFTPNSVVQIDGRLRTTTFVSATQLSAAIPAADIAAAGTFTITVSTPEPGGGASNGLPLTAEALTGPSLALDTTGALPGGAVTATLANGLGGDTDWLALAQVGAPDTSFLQWIYVGAGVTTRAWTINMPAAPGQYEFRLFPNNGHVRAATSPALTVSLGNSTPGTGPGVAIDSARAEPGNAVTATLINGFGGNADWLALAAVGSPTASFLQWVYVGAGVTTRTWTITMPTTPGQYEVRFFPNDSYILTATSPAITVGN